uniref:Uncharacterized protein n=1 Tax=Strigamia maritima TaxID=126957 RepID=T1IXI8_STRMM
MYKRKKFYGKEVDVVTIVKGRRDQYVLKNFDAFVFMGSVSKGECSNYELQHEFTDSLQKLFDFIKIDDIRVVWSTELSWRNNFKILVNARIGTCRDQARMLCIDETITLCNGRLQLTGLPTVKLPDAVGCFLKLC